MEVGDFPIIGEAITVGIDGAVPDEDVRFRIVVSRGEVGSLAGKDDDCAVVVDQWAGGRAIRGWRNRRKQAVRVMVDFAISETRLALAE